MTDPDRDEPGELAEQATAALTLDELLEQASREQAQRFGVGTLIGECLDTHNPHLPHRVFVRALADDGQPVCAWLPVLEHVRVRPGARVLLSRPDNWTEPVVIGALAGGGEKAETVGAQARPGDGPQLQLEHGQSLVVVGPDGRPLVRLTATAEGPRVELLHDDVDLDVAGRVRIGAERIELHSREGGVDVRTDGDAIVRGRVIRLN